MPSAAALPSSSLAALGKDERLIVHSFESNNIETSLHLYEGLTTAMKG